MISVNPDLIKDQPLVRSVDETKRQGILKLIRTFPTDEATEFNGTIPSELADRLRQLCIAISVSKRDAILTGIDVILSRVKSPDQLRTMTYKCRASQLRRMATLIVGMPTAMEQRLTTLLKCAPGITSSDLMIVGLNDLLDECESTYGGAFLPNRSLLNPKP